MSAFSEVRRAEVAIRAGHCCEYCHLPTRGQVATFPIDHVIPRGRGGTTVLSNLALTCPHCNAHKWIELEVCDPDTGKPLATSILGRILGPIISSGLAFNRAN